MKNLKEVIVKEPDDYHVKSEKGKNLGGPYSTREEAEKRLGQVEYFKHQHESKSFIDKIIKEAKK